MMRRAILSMTLSVALSASLFVVRVQGAVPLTVRIAPFQMVAPGRVRVDVAIAGLRPELRPTMVDRVTLGGQSIHGTPFPVIAARIPTFIDLAAGRVRIGGDASVGEFTPVPPLRETLPIALEIAVRQGNETAVARQSGVLMLPTIIVPGYLNDIAGPDPTAISVLEQRGYRATGPSPDLFWFSYASRGLGLEEASQALAAYVRDMVLPKTYATRINVVGYSLGGLLARWNMAFEPGWDRLVNRFVMLGVPNEGTVMSYVGAWYALAAPWARTAAARSLLPTFPFWRPAANASWGLPPGVRNPLIDKLNAHPLPDHIRAYAFYANRPSGPDGRGTWAGITGDLPKAGFSYGPGDGIVLTASVLGLPINGGPGVPGLADRLVMKVDLGAVGHLSLLETAMPKIADALTDGDQAEWTSPPKSEMRQGREPARGIRLGVGFPDAGAGLPEARERP
jgi:hypothetical protein